MDTILVVEDEVAIREMLERGLRQRGYEVLVAEDGDEALRMCLKHSNPIQVLLCDVVTPGAGGT
jgi:CheY-like chemotaxis protein